MSQQPIDGISGIKRAAPGAQTEVNDLKQGELALDETTEGDVAARFRGDGVTTPSKVVARFLELNVAKDPLLDTMKGSESAAFLGAEMALRANPDNRKLLVGGQSADKPIPADELFTCRQSELKKALAPFKGKLDELRVAVSNMQPAGEMTSGQSKTLGKAFTPALGLPVDPNH